MQQSVLYFIKPIPAVLASLWHCGNAVVAPMNPAVVPYRTVPYRTTTFESAFLNGASSLSLSESKMFDGGSAAACSSQPYMSDVVPVC
jgi:hypothetical protein